MILIRKYKYGGLEIEITRRCNKACDHCVNGEPQNITITKEVIDKIFENVNDCDQIAIVGGEPTLELDMLEFLIERIITSDWSTKIIQVTTNGKIKDRRLIDMLKRFCESKKGRRALVRVSNDMFHDRAEYEPALKFYKEAATDVPDKITVMYAGEIKSLKYDGRAKKYIDDHPEYLSGHSFVMSFPMVNKRIRIEDDFIPCMLLISATGELCNDYNDSSFKTNSRLAIGNIMDDSMANLIEKNNENSLITCMEQDAYYYANSWRFAHYYDFDVMLSMKAYKLIIERLLYIRKWAKDNFPLCPASDIIERIPLDPIYNPKNEETHKLFFVEYQNLIRDIFLFSKFKESASASDPFFISKTATSWLSEKTDFSWQHEYALRYSDEETRKVFEEKTKNINDPEKKDYLLMLLFVIALLTEANKNDPAMPYVYLPGFEGDKWHILTHSKAFKELDELHQKYIYNQNIPDNTKNFPCDPE